MFTFSQDGILPDGRVVTFTMEIPSAVTGRLGQWWEWEEAKRLVEEAGKGEAARLCPELEPAAPAGLLWSAHA